MGWAPTLVGGAFICLLSLFALFSSLSTHGSNRITLHKVKTTSLAINSYADTTGPGIPMKVREVLRSKYGEVDEGADNFFGSAAAVAKLEEECGWDGNTSNFKNPACTKQFGFQRDPEVDDNFSHNDIDIVVPSIRDLDFLEVWKPFFLGYHIIIVQDGDPSKVLKVPDWADYELYNRHDIQKALGKRDWIISSRDASIRNFGFLVSRKKYVYTIDDDCLPATRADGTKVNAIQMHLRNLRTNSTPYFFNTLYDPYQRGSDFVRGYPYSLRQGVPTGLSHGLWLNAPDYDAPTQLLKPEERNVRHYEVTLTVPAGVLYPMCSMNVAFNRELIGPAFMQGLMGDGQPWARYDDMFAGWASKVVADHLHLGVKSGAPYIRHNKASNPFTNLKKEYKGLFWQEELIDFFDKVTFSSCNTPQTCYVELAGKIRKKFARLHNYFSRLAKAMETWVQVWDEAASGKIRFIPSRTSRQRNVAIVTAQSTTEDITFLTAWVYHYQRSFRDDDIYVIAAPSSNGSLPQFSVNVEALACGTDVNFSCTRKAVDRKLNTLFGMGYKVVVFTEPSELLFAPKGLSSSLCSFQDAVGHATGYGLFDKQAPDSNPIDWTQPLVPQRPHWFRDAHPPKAVVFTDAGPLATEAQNKSASIDSSNNQTEAELVLVHIVRADRNYSLQHLPHLRGHPHHETKAAQTWYDSVKTQVEPVPQWLLTQSSSDATHQVKGCHQQQIMGNASKP